MVVPDGEYNRVWIACVMAIHGVTAKQLAVRVAKQEGE
jgi:hypothetical protein